MSEDILMENQQENIGLNNNNPVPDTEVPQKSGIFDNKRVLLLGSILGVACWSLAGNTCRLAIQGAFLNQTFLVTHEKFGPNAIGCFIMGFISSLASMVTRETKFPWIYNSILVGFCGSLTTFSGWILDVVGQENAALAIGELISGLTMPFIFLIWGRDCALVLRPIIQKVLRGMNKAEYSCGNLHMVNFFFLIFSIVATVVIPIVIEVFVHHETIDVSFADRRAVVLGPAGAVPRFLLALLLNGLSCTRKFPLGTLLSNIIAVILTGIFDYYYRKTGNEWYSILMNGLCGSLSTVSSFVNEIVGQYTNGMRGMAYLYAFISLAINCAILAICRHAFP
ncbi:CrcB-like protein [Trypanosoma theileri]|uniref:CrcB-like protein n=1 Tax=Trypanosoma theileri TaxID=67003 RepID=A0A1X0NID7_9TRYP|nr:CrcB-like protein [Trypanosoma theileri]ORC84522.1 CrcB-like protein [Trypanosoma theileri]